MFHPPDWGVVSEVKSDWILLQDMRLKNGKTKNRKGVKRQKQGRTRLTVSYEEEGRSSLTEGSGGRRGRKGEEGSGDDNISAKLASGVALPSTRNSLASSMLVGQIVKLSAALAVSLFAVLLSNPSGEEGVYQELQFIVKYFVGK
jgi:hypothetical protein